MKDSKQKQQLHNQEPEQTYQTGSTHPPKNRGGLIAFLLVLVIFLCGIITALGFMNVRLFQQLTTTLSAQDEASPVAFLEAPSPDEPLTDGSLTEFAWGFSGQSVSEFWQHYHDLPQGIYVAEVEDSMIAEKLGILPGDILMQINNTPISDVDSFHELLEMLSPGEEVSIDISRSGSEISINIIIE